MAVGYGESKPVDSNDTKDGRANNRRTEFGSDNNVYACLSKYLVAKLVQVFVIALIAIIAALSVQYSKGGM